MPIPHTSVGRIRDVAAHIKELEERLMSNRVILLAEQSVIHAQIRQLKKELEVLEKRTR